MYKSLSDYIAALDAAGELVRVDAPVDPVLEIAEITDRMSKSPDGGKALLFENTGTGFPVLTNMMGSPRRIAMALGVGSLDELTCRIDALLGEALQPRQTLRDKLRALPLLGEMARWMPKVAGGRGRCQEVVALGDDVDLSELPVLKCWPCDGGRFVTLPLVNTVDPHIGVRNVGMYRMQILGRQSTAMHWHIHKTGARHYCEYGRLGRRMPVSVCLGGDPAYTYAATAPMPDNMDEYLLAGFLRRSPVRLVKSLTNDIYVPEDCDFVIEGYVDPAENMVCEGPFGDHTGFYSLEDMYPVFHVTAVTRRRDAVYPATLVGIPPQEDAYIAMATEKIFLAPIRMALQPEVRDLYMPVEGVAHNMAVVDIETSYAGQARKVAGSMWGAGQMMFNKFLLVTSMPAGQTVRDTAVLAGVLRSRSIPDDVMFSQGVLDVLDHAAAQTGVGGKLMVDATISREAVAVIVPDEPLLSGGIVAVDVSTAQGWGAVWLFCAVGAKIDVARWLGDNDISGVNYVVLLDEAASGLGYGDRVWLAAANADAVRDVSVMGSVLVVDGRTKRPDAEGMPRRFPNPVTSSAVTVAKVDSRWEEYGIGGFIPSPSLGYAGLVRPGGAQIEEL